jgi:hypothetical protein
MTLQSPNYLRDCIVKAIILLEMTPCGKPFTEEEVQFFQNLYLWRRPDKFFKNDNEAKIISGTTAIYQPGNQKTLQFVFDNGYVWMASITKLNKNRIKECRKLAQDFLDEEIQELSNVA